MIEAKLDEICKHTEYERIPLEDRKGIGAYLKQLHDHDPKGVSFRYGRERDMRRTLQQDVVHINIRSFAICMEKLSDYLSGLNDWLDDMVTSSRDPEY